MTQTFTRDRLTWLMYLLLALFAFLEALPGPMMPFLGDELDLSYTVRGFHFSGFALGLVVAGLIGERVSVQLGRRKALLIGGLGMASGLGLLIIAQHAVLSIAGLFLIGAIGGLVFVMVQAILADYHGTNRATALTEANIVASMGAGLAPLLIGMATTLEIGWRGALLIPILFWAILTWTGRHIDLPNTTSIANTDSAKRSTATRLPNIFWGYAALLFMGVAIEWSVIYWGAEFLTETTTLGRATAVNLMTLYFVAFIAGRFVSSRLTRHYSADYLLIGAFTLTALGFIPFWLSTNVVLSIVGLFIVGGGISSLFPLSLALATGVVANDQTDAASSRISLMVGLAIFLAPQILGSLADEFGLTAAYGIVAVLLMVALFWAGYLIRRAKVGQTAQVPA